MARWLVQLVGEHMDLAEFPRCFPDGDIFALEENGNFYLAGQAFEVLGNVEAVRQEASRALDRFAGVIYLLWPNLRKPKLSGAMRDNDDGSRDAYPFIAGASLRTKGGAVFAGSPPARPRVTRGQELLSRAAGRPALERAISLWSGPRSWPRLFRILEEIEQDLGKTVAKAGFCSDNLRERFTRSAQSAEAAGDDARHAARKFAPPPKPMTLQEGMEFVAQILRTALS